ncbi:hypothetical protein EXS65_01300 [Candidatus Peribacteria bacterium]|nr:hypothetical protein [Candidatus Peribacteria bacterium]
MNATEVTLLEEYVKTSPAPGLPCVKIDQESISPIQALENARSSTDDADAVFLEMVPLIKKFLKTNLL